jgi:cytochrome P450
MTFELSAEEFEFYNEHFDRVDSRESALHDRAVTELAIRCPVVHSDARGGYWVANQYRSVVSVFQDWETFSSRVERKVLKPPVGRPTMPPIEVDPPIQRDYRRILNPYLTPRKVAVFEPGIRALVTELIDGFSLNGACDLASQFARPFPGRMLYRFLLGLDDSEVARVQEWTFQTVFAPEAPETAEAQRRWNEWIHGIIESRRSSAKREDDLVDGLLHGSVEGRSLTDEEIAGCLEVLILGGFGTTADSILYTMWRLAERPELRDRLRDHPDEIPKAIDEFIRFDPPVAGMDRLCTRDSVINGQEVKRGERIWMFFAAANRDPSEFERANELDIDRVRNRHVSFGLGMHRCVGSNVARMNLKVALEELLRRLPAFRISDGQAPERTWRGISRLPLTFDRSPQEGDQPSRIEQEQTP